MSFELIVCVRILLGITALLSLGLVACTPAVTTGLRSAQEARRFHIQEGPSLPRSRGGHSAEMLDGRLFVLGGNDWSTDRTRKDWLSDTLIFERDTWQAGPSLPFPLAYAASGVDEHNLYLAGGSDGARSLPDVFFLSVGRKASAWSRRASLPMGISSAGGVVEHHAMYLACGETGSGMSNQMFRLALSKPQAAWHTCEPLPAKPRALPGLVECNGFIYLFGGVSSWQPLTPLRDAYRYNPRTDQWSRLADLPWAGYAWTGSSVDRNHVLLAGRADGEIHPDIWLLDLGTMGARKIGDAVIQTTTAPLVKVTDREWWLIGGEPDSQKTRTNRVTIVRAIE